MGLGGVDGEVGGVRDGEGMRGRGREGERTHGGHEAGDQGIEGGPVS